MMKAIAFIAVFVVSVAMADMSVIGGSISIRERDHRCNDCSPRHRDRYYEDLGRRSFAIGLGYRQQLPPPVRGCDGYWYQPVPGPCGWELRRIQPPSATCLPQSTWGNPGFQPGWGTPPMQSGWSNPGWGVAEPQSAICQICGMQYWGGQGHICPTIQCPRCGERYQGRYHECQYRCQTCGGIYRGSHNCRGPSGYNRW